MARVPIAAVYADRVSSLGVGTAPRPDVINRVPEPDETDAPFNTPIELKIVDVGTHGLAVSTIVDITTIGQGTVNAFTQGVGFHATYTGNSTFTTQTSPGGSTTDEHLLQLVRNTPFVSQESVTVRVRAQTVDGKILDRTHSFTVEDATAPTLNSVVSSGLTKLLVRFSEPMLMTTGITGALRVREISGRVTPRAPQFFEIEKANFTTDSAEDFISIINSEKALNNSYFKIGTVIDSKNVEVLETSVQTEGLNLNIQCWTGAYKLEAVMDVEDKIPTFTPSIISAEQFDTSTVLLTLDQELSPNRRYRLTAVNVSDLAEPPNVQSITSAEFTSEPLQTYVNRSFSLWDMMPLTNKQQDFSGDAERLVRCLDEVAQLVLHEVDRFSTLNDVDLAPTEALDVLLASIGNNFTFLDTDLLKRRTILNTVNLFKDGGIARGIQNAVQFFLELPIIVRPFHLLDGWILGESTLGDDTILGTDVKFLLYSFEIVTDRVLTQTQRDIISEIANKLKTAHTHFVRFVEPS